MRKSKFRKGLVLGIIVLFIGASVVSSNMSYNIKPSFNESSRNEITDGLIGYWSFDEGNGSIAYDYSGFGNNGTVYDATWITGISDYALEFDGLDDYVDMGDPSSVLDFGVGEFTESYWIYPYSFTGGIDGHIQLDVTSPPSRLISGQYGNTLYVYTNDGNWHDTGITVEVSEWAFIVWVKVGDVLKLYINGTYSGWSMGHTTSLGPVFSMYVGRHSTEIFHGIIDEVRMYNRSLNDSEILNLYTNPGDSPVVVYVDDDYNETTPGWGYDHFNKIQYGVDAVNESGTVYVYNGTYNEWVNITKTIELHGEDRDNTIIDGTGLTYCLQALYPANNIVITNLTTQNSQSIGVYVSASNSIIDNVTSCWNTNYGFYPREYASNVVIKNCLGHNNTRGIFDKGTDGLEVYGCTFRNNTDYGMNTYTETTNIYIHHNNFISNGVNAEDVSDGSNLWDYNYYDDYSGIDADGDGIGDTPYDIEGSAGEQDLHPLMHHFELYYILNITAPSEVNEGELFNVFVTSIGGPVVPLATVEFNDELKLTDSDGRAYFIAPLVGEDTYYEITATKDGYTSDTETVLVKDVPVEFVSTFIFGRIDNLTTGGDVITFEAVNIRCMTFFPFTFNGYTSGELITISKNPKGFVGALFGVQLIFAFCGLAYQPSTSTISMNKFSQDDFANTVIWLVSGVEGPPVETKDVEMILLNESGQPQPDAEITFNEVNVEGYINPGDTFTVVAPSDGYYVFMLTHKISGATIYKGSLTHY